MTEDSVFFKIKSLMVKFNNERGGNLLCFGKSLHFKWAKKNTQYYSFNKMVDKSVDI